MILKIRNEKGNVVNFVENFNKSNNKIEKMKSNR